MVDNGPATLDISARIARLTLNRPDAYNAIDLPMAQTLTAHMATIVADETVQGIIITGAGKAFCAGGDIRWTAAHPLGLAAAFHELATNVHVFIMELRNIGKPVVAAINGVAA